MDNDNLILNGTVITTSYDLLNDIMYNINNISRFIWIIGKQGIGKTHILNYIWKKYESKNEYLISNIDTLNLSENCDINEFDFFLINEFKNRYPKLISQEGNEITEIIAKLKKYIQFDNVILLIDNFDKDIEKFLSIINKQNQNYFERLIDDNFIFFITLSNELLSLIDTEYFSGEKIVIEPLTTRGEIRKLLQLKYPDIISTPQLCITLLKNTGGVPNDILINIRNIRDKEEELEIIHNKFIVKNMNKIDDLSKKIPLHNFKTKLIEWLCLFPEIEDKELALKLINFIDYIDEVEIRKLLIDNYNGIMDELGLDDPWEEVIVCQAGVSYGKSGGFILYRLRRLAKITPDQCSFIGEIKEKICGKTKAIIFVDDFIGTGNQCIELWQEVMDNPSDIKYYFLCISALRTGIDKIKKKTKFKVVCGKIFEDDKKIFSDKNTYFTKKEKNRLHELCLLYGEKNPFGYGNSQVCIVFEHTTPNNTIELISGTSEIEGLFPRRRL